MELVLKGRSSIILRIERCLPIAYPSLARRV
jgi:hypothetical protein